MHLSLTAQVVLIALVGLLMGCEPERTERFSDAADSVVVRIATYNIEDVRTTDLQNPDHPRLKQAAATIQRLRPDVLLINEMTYDQPGIQGSAPEVEPGQNPQRFVDHFLSVSQGEGLEPLRYRTFTAPTNTGEASGFDLNNDALIVTEHPALATPSLDGSPPPQTQPERDYGNDAWGFGTFPGQYGMALFIREDLDLLADDVRTFRLLPWSAMPDASQPVDPETGEPWYSEAEWEQARLSSKSHWDVPVRLPNGRVLHVLASHPTPPAFDGPERRNVFRNHDEIRFWVDYLNGAAYIVDDAGQGGGLPEGDSFVLLGDLNADPDEGDAWNNPVETWLLSHPRVNGTVVPRATEAGIAAYPDLDPDDTAGWGLRVDYVLPSSDLHVLDSGIARPVDPDTTGIQVSDHFPVWIDVAVPGS